MTLSQRSLFCAKPHAIKCSEVRLQIGEMQIKSDWTKKKFKGRAGRIISLKLESQNASVSSWSVIYSCFLKNMQFPSQSYCENRHKQSAIHRILLSSLSCHWLYFNFVDWDAIHFTITNYSDLPQCFYPLISSNTQRKSSWDSILLMPISYNTRHFPVQSLNIFQETYVLQLQNYQGFWKVPQVSCPAIKHWFVFHWWENKVRTLALQNPSWSTNRESPHPWDIFKTTCLHHSFL